MAPQLLLLLATACPATADREVVRIEAEVVRFTEGALIEHYDDGSWGVFHAVEFKITTPPRWTGQRLRVYCTPGEEPAAVRKVGVRCRFGIEETFLTPPQRDSATATHTTHVPFAGTLEDFEELE